MSIDLPEESVAVTTLPSTAQDRRAGRGVSRRASRPAGVVLGAGRCVRPCRWILDPRGRAALALLFALACATPAPAQQRDSIPGATLGMVYDASSLDALAIKPLGARFGGGSAAGQVEAILARDLRYSDRFEVMDSLPGEVLGQGIDYRLWDQLGATWLLSGQVEGSGDGYILILELHDVVYSQQRRQERFAVPEPTSPGFRMAVHRASDAVVEWITGEPGMAASRIAFSIRSTNEEGVAVQDIYTIDSDGENLQRVTRFSDLTMNPAWSPDGRRLAYVSYKDGDGARLYELDLETRTERKLDVGRGGTFFAPAYHPDGQRLAFAIAGDRQSGIYSFDLDRRCCLVRMSGGRYEDLSPTFSPDGRRMAFNSNRLGTATPQIYVMGTDGGDADLVSPYEYGRGGYYTSPDWAPTGDRVAFHGRIERGRYQILVADVRDRGGRLRQLTWEGNNEDPTWAPDGRHLAFVGERTWGFGLFVVDAASGRLRPLVTGRNVRVPDWSGSLGADAASTLRSGG